MITAQFIKLLLGVFFGSCIYFHFCCSPLESQKRFPNFCDKEVTVDGALEPDFVNDETISDLDNKVIKISGELTLLFESMSVNKNGSRVQIELNKTISGRLNELLVFNGRKVELFGVFRLSERGAHNSYNATLDSVFCVKLAN